MKNTHVFMESIQRQQVQHPDIVFTELRYNGETIGIKSINQRSENRLSPLLDQTILNGNSIINT